MDTTTILLILFAIAMVAMHLFGHGGHGSHGHGGRGQGDPRRNPSETPPPDDPSAVAGREPAGRGHH